MYMLSMEICLCIVVGEKACTCSMKTCVNTMAEEKHGHALYEDMS